MATGFGAFGSALATVIQHMATPKKFRYNLVARRNYRTLYYLFGGRPMADLIKAGSDVRARLFDNATATAGFYDVATADHEPQIDENGVWAIAYWCAHMAKTSYKEEVLAVNSGGWTEGSVAEETMTQELWSKYQELMTVLYNSWSDAFWAVPDKATMAGSSPTKPHSIPAFLNAFTNSLFQETPGTSSTYWTAVNTVDPTVTTRYVPDLETYGAGGAGFTPNNSANLIPAMAKAFRKTSFEPPPTNKEYFDPEHESTFDSSGGFVACSAEGIGRVETLYQNSQHRWADFNDPSNNPRYSGVQYVYEERLDDAALYLNTATTGLTTELLADLTGPRYYGVNGKYMKMYFHRAKFMEMLDPFREHLTTWTQGINSLGTLLCPDRSKHFLVSPSADN